MADSPTSVTPQSNPAISDPAMDTNQIYEHESERPQQVSPDSNIQLAQNDPPHFDNPRNAEVSDSDSTPLMSDSSVAQSNQLGLADKSTAIGGRNRKVEALNYADELAERGQPRDIGNWSNGDADELMNTKSVWKAEDENMRGFERSKLNKVSEKSHDLVQLPSGHVIAVPKNLPEDKKNSIVKGLWSELTDASNSVKNAASNAAQALGLPGDMPEWQLKTDEFMRDPIGEAGNAVGALLHGFNTQLAQIAPLSDENKALVQRATDQYKQGNALAAAVTMVPLVGDNLAKAVVQAKKHDFSGSLGTSVGTALPFLTGAEEEPLPISKEKPVVPTTTSYVHTPDQSGQFGNLTHAVTTKDLQGNVVGHLAAQDTAPGEVTVRSNQIYDAAHQGQGKGTSQLRTLVNETAKDPAIKTIHSDISTTGAARGAWDKLAMEHPDVVTKENIKGTPRYSVNLDKVRENAANAPEFNGVERRGSARSAPMGATDLEQAMKNPGQRIQTPFDVTEGAMDTINKDINKRLEPLEGPKPPKARAASAPTQSVGAASINDLNTKEDVPPFYSKAEQIIGEKVSNNASGDQIKNVLKNAGVKDDEMKWSGLDDYLSGKTKVSKSDLQQYIAEHKLSVQDVDLGKEQRYNLSPNFEETTHAGEPMFDVKDPQNGLTRFTGTEHAAHDYMSELGQGLNGDELHEMRTIRDQIDKFNEEDTKRSSQQIADLRQAREQHGTMSVEAKAAEKAIDSSESNYERINELRPRLRELEEKSTRGAVNRQTQYGTSTGLGGGDGDWTVPGPKRNYQEKLLTLPSQTKPLAEETTLADFQDKLTNKYGSVERARSSMTDEERAQGKELSVAAREAREANPKAESDYEAPHFQKGEKQPNIVAHMRFSDRDAVNGKKTLFLEEAQSDWHSAGRHEGYQGDAKAIDAANKRIAAAEAERTQHVQSVMDRVNDLRSKMSDQDKIDYGVTGKVDHDPASRSIHYTLRDAMTTDEWAKYKELQDKVSQEENVKRGLKAGGVPDAPFKQNWHELAMKRMLRHAAENGYEQMAWTTGKQQADLYGLEHHFSRLEYDPESGHLEGYDPQGHRVLQEKVDPDVKSLAEYMGPELAEKMADKIQDYHDNDLGQLNEDAIYDSVAQQYGVSEIGGSAEVDEEGNEVGEPKWEVTNDYGDPDGPFDSQYEAERFLQNRIQDDVRSEMENYEAERPETPTLSGLDLHHGGEFHKLLYDQMIPSFLKKYAKKWGAEVGTTDIKNMGEPGAPEYQGPDLSPSEVDSKAEGLTPRQLARLSDIVHYMKDRKVGLKEAMAAHNPGPIMHFLAEKLGGKMVNGASKATVHSIPITEEMRKSVMKQGQPIAKSEQPDRKKIFGQLGSALA